MLFTTPRFLYILLISSSVRLNYTGLVSPYKYVKVSYDLKTNKPVFTKENPEGISLPLFAWAEFNLFHKSANN